MVARFFLAALLLSESVLMSARDAGAGGIVSRALVESGQEAPANSTTASGQADFSFDRKSGAYSVDLIISGLTPTNITFPDGNSLAFGAVGAVHLYNGPKGAKGPVVAAFDASLLYSETGDGFRLKAFGPLESLLTGITSAASLNRLALRSADVDVQSFPNFPGGSVRGQIVAIPEPDSLTLLCFGLVVLAVSRLVRRLSGKVLVFRALGLRRTGFRPSKSVSTRALGW